MPLNQALGRFYNDERGMMTHLALVVMLIVLMFSGMSLDTSNARRMRSILQTAADASVRAAIMDLPDKTTALETALALANANLPPDSVNSAVTSESVIFGHWDEDAETFTAGNSNPNAIKVVATRSSANSNPVPTMLLRFAGFESWNIASYSVAYRSQTSCETADIQSNGQVSFTSNNDFYNSFCIAAQSISLNNNNYFDNDNRIQVPDLDDVSLPGSSGFSTSVGRGTDDSSSSLTYADIFEVKPDLAAAYSADIATVATNYLDPSWDGQPAYVNTSAAVISVAAKNVKYTWFIPGRIYNVSCGGGDGNKAQIYSGAVLSEVVIVSDCKIQIGSSAVLTDVVLVSADTSNKSVYAASKVQLGADDDCAEGGEVKVFAAGDFDSAAKLETYGVTISAIGNVNIAGKTDGIAGLDIFANGDVSFSAQASLGVCSGGQTGTLADVYSLVQ